MISAVEPSRRHDSQQEELKENNRVMPKYLVLEMGSNI